MLSTEKITFNEIHKLFDYSAKKEKQLYSGLLFNLDPLTLN